MAKSYGGGGGGGGGAPATNSGVFLQIAPYLQAIRKASEVEDGKDLANLFSYKVISKRLGYQFARTDIEQCVRNSPVNRVDDADIPQVLLHFLTAVGKISDGDLQAAFVHHEQALKGVVEVIKQYESGTEWVLHWYRKLARGLRLVATQIDKAGASMDQHLDKVIHLLRTHFGEFQSQGARGRLSIALAIGNELIMLYLATNNANACKPITQWADKVVSLEEKDFAAGKFSKGDAVAYHYLRARLLLLDTQYAQVDRYLGYAFRHCHPSSPKNMRIILSYTVPVKLNLGLFPKPGILEKHNLTEFITLVAALREGNFKVYQEQLDLYQVEFIARGIYIILEKLKLFVYRNLFKKMWLLNNKESRLSIATCFDAHKSIDPQSDMDIDELECIIANLIQRKKIRGYIAHEMRMLVLSKENAFPPYQG